MGAKDTEEVLARAAHEDRLTDAEIQKVRDFLTTINALGRIGKFLLWAVIAAGGVATAIQNLRAQWP